MAATVFTDFNTCGFNSYNRHINNFVCDKIINMLNFIL